jgi:N-acetylglucosaminyldiphosphoundecaprenol N-acetyl-beta-D-mannosaminyltransferase
MTDSRQLGHGIARCDLMGMDLACVKASELLDEIFGMLSQGKGGWLITANLDFLHRCSKDSQARALYAEADLRVADGMPLVWAARLQGENVPERIAGSSLVLQLAQRAASEQRSIYLLGGKGDAAQRAGIEMQARFANLKVAGTCSPMISSPPTDDEVNDIVATLVPLQPSILMVGLGSPKQEHLIQKLRAHLPSTFMVGVGISFSFIAGDLNRAPAWMQKSGLEWLHRMAQEPGRLAKRYLVDDLPFVTKLFHSAWTIRRQRRPDGVKQG